MKSIYECFYCHNKFERYSSQVRHPEHVYCSRSCQASNTNIGISNPNYRDGNTLNVVCSCGKPKDSRAHKCSCCAGRGFPVGYISGDNPKAPETARKKMLRGLYQCLFCGLGPEWQGKPLVLHMDHIDGNRKNNKEENLRWLCPNCHSQTETFAKPKV